MRRKSLRRKSGRGLNLSLIMLDFTEYAEHVRKRLASWAGLRLQKIRALSWFKRPLRASGGLKQVFEMLVKMGKDTPRCGGGRRADGKMWRSEKAEFASIIVENLFFEMLAWIFKAICGG